MRKIQKRVESSGKRNHPRTSTDTIQDHVALMVSLSFYISELERDEIIRKRFNRVHQGSNTNALCFSLKRGQQAEATTIPSELGMDIHGKGILYCGRERKVFGGHSQKARILGRDIIYQ